MADYSIEVVDLASEKRTHLIDDGTDARFVASGHLLFARSGALFAIRFDPVALRIGGEAVRVLPDVMHSVGGNSPGRAIGAAQFDMSATGTLVFLPGGAMTRRAERIAWLYGGGRVEPLELEPMPYFAPMVSPDGRQIALSAGARTGNTAEVLYKLDIERGVLTPVIKDASWPLWTPDGSRLIVKMKGRRSEMALYSLAL